MLDQKAESLCKKLNEIHKGKRAKLDRKALETKLYYYICKEHDVIKTSFSTFENFLSTKAQKMMLDNANNLLKKCEEYFKAPIPVAKLSYTSCTGKQPINGNVVKELHGK